MSFVERTTSFEFWGIFIQGGTKSRQNYIPRNVDPKGDGAQDEFTGAEPGGENISSADRCVEEEAGRIVGDHRK